ALGLHGSALSTILTSLLTLCAYYAAICIDRKLRRYHILGRWWRAEWSRLRDILKIGTPIALTVIAEGGLFGSAAFLMGLIGPAQLAGHTIALQVAAFAFQLPFGVGQAVTIRVGYHFGAKNHAAISQAGKAAMLVCVVFSFVAAAAMVAFPRQILAAYVDTTAPANAAMVGFAVQYLVIAAAFQLFDGTQAVAAGALRGLQDTRMPMIMALGGYWLGGFATAIYLGFALRMGGLGVWLGLATGLILVSALLLMRWQSRGRLGLLPQ
ncbi:MAG: hypothetical protein RLY97_1955, partial [Pseudomonadota bacterium]